MKRIYAHQERVFFVQRLFCSFFQQLFQLKPCQIKTKSDSQIISLCFRTTICQQSIKFIGPKIWNTLPQEIKNCSILVSFKNKLKIYYLTGAIPDEST